MTKEERLDVEALRGKVVHSFANLESLIDAVIALEYVDREQLEAFDEDVLADAGFSSALRVSVLEKVLQRHKWGDKEAKAKMQTLRELQNTRNLFAHAGHLAVIEKNGRVALEYRDPKKPGGGLDFATRFEKFEPDCREVEAFVLTIVERLSPFHGDARGIRKRPEWKGPRGPVRPLALELTRDGEVATLKARDATTQAFVGSRRAEIETCLAAIETTPATFTQYGVRVGEALRALYPDGSVVSTGHDEALCVVRKYVVSDFEGE